MMKERKREAEKRKEEKGLEKDKKEEATKETPPEGTFEGDEDELTTGKSRSKGNKRQDNKGTLLALKQDEFL